MLVCRHVPSALLKEKEFQAPGSVTPWNNDEWLNMNARCCADFKRSYWTGGIRSTHVEGSEGKDAFVFFSGYCLHFAPPPGLDLSHQFWKGVWLMRNTKSLFLQDAHTPLFLVGSSATKFANLHLIMHILIHYLKKKLPNFTVLNKSSTQNLPFILSYQV